MTIWPLPNNFTSRQPHNLLYHAAFPESFRFIASILIETVNLNWTSEANAQYRECERRKIYL
jgi:hypothetical protein